MANQKLGQIAVMLDGMRTRIKEVVSDLYKLVQKPAAFTGYTRTYAPYSTQTGREAQQPPEQQLVQVRFREVVVQAQKAWTELIDGTYMQDTGNTRAVADIVVDGQVVAEKVPVTTIMFLIKQFVDVLTFAAKLPTPDPGIEWEYDTNQGLLRSKSPEIVKKTQKVPKVLVHFEPTQHHPGKSEAYTVDEAVGEYTKTSYSGGCPHDVKNEIVSRATKLVEALKVARESANISTEVPPAKIAGSLLTYVFAPLNKAA